MRAAVPPCGAATPHPLIGIEIGPPLYVPVMVLP